MSMTVLSQEEALPCSSEVLKSLWIPSSSQSFHGSKSMVNFENFNGRESPDGSFFQQLDKEENEDEDFDACFHQPGKKRRLTANQVQFLEKNFELENKLEPERKLQLAKELGLQPRQVAIWFQNRRARFKTKQLEKDYDSLKSNYERLKVDYENLLKESESLKNEVNSLEEKFLSKEKGKENLVQQDQSPIPRVDLDHVAEIPMVICKQETASSAKSDVVDSDSSHYGENQCLEPADSSHVFEPDQSDFSQDEEDNLMSKSLFPPPYFQKLEACCYDEPNASSCNFGFAVEDQPFYFWP
ncbi:hypothetical protein UlMin_041362 [Ulmus minor]